VRRVEGQAHSAGGSIAWGAAALWVLLAAGCPGGSGDESEVSAAETSGGTEAVALEAPVLFSPSDTAVDVPIDVGLCWEPVEAGGTQVGYRVWVDEVELSNGKLGELGFSDTCTGPLDFLEDRQYTWRVRAFDRDLPASESPDSELWAFKTAWISGARPVFFDDFSEHLGWTVSGDASEGAWVRGLPELVYDLDAQVSQPGTCQIGDGCYFTGHNPDKIDGGADVDGGTTTLTSPAFDAPGALSLSVSLARFFHRSDLELTGLSLRIELLVPDPEAPGGETVHVLEKLDGPSEADSNAWESVAFAACGVELRPGMRLRIHASDSLEPEAAIVEAAIDEVLVEAYVDMDLCSPGEGALCDPDDPEPACGAEFACCARGPIFDGVYRCVEPVAGIGDGPPESPGGPLTGALGCPAPDLAVLDSDIEVYTQSLWIEPDSCSLYEGCVDGTGWRRVLRFDTKTANIGARDLVLGVPANHPDLYTYSPCHEHHHFDNYAAYSLFEPGEAEPIAEGHKQAFCLLDWESWAWPELTKDVDGTYTCYNQGLSVGWSDTYAANLDCQWIDVTDVDPGEYMLRMEVNIRAEGHAHAPIVEQRYDNNRIEIAVTVD